MLRIVVVILLALWLLGWVLRAFGWVIHLLLLLVLALVIYRLVTNRRPS